MPHLGAPVYYMGPCLLHTLIIIPPPLYMFVYLHGAVQMVRTWVLDSSVIVRPRKLQLYAQDPQ